VLDRSHHGLTVVKETSRGKLLVGAVRKTVSGPVLFVLFTNLLVSKLLIFLYGFEAFAVS